MARVLGRTEVTLSREQSKEVFAKSAAALETLERALTNVDGSLSEAEATASVGLRVTPAKQSNG